MMAKTIKVAAIQTSYREDMQANIAKTECFVRAAGKRALFSRLNCFRGPYFCTTRRKVVRHGI